MLVSQTTSYGRMGEVPDADELSRKEVFFFTSAVQERDGHWQVSSFTYMYFP